jgi:hypothetical protein
MFFSTVDLSAALLCPDPSGYIRRSLFSLGSIVVIDRLYFRLSRVPGTHRITEVDIHIGGHCKTLVFGHLQLAIPCGYSQIGEIHLGGISHMAEPFC